MDQPAAEHPEVSDGFALPNGVTLRVADPAASFERDEIEHWVTAVRSRGLRLSSVPEEYRVRVHSRLCEVLVHDQPCPNH